MSVIIRPATADDMPSIVAIERAVFPDPWPELMLRDTSDQPHMHVWCALASDGAVCGYVYLMECGGDEAEILNIAVAAAHQRRGIAQQLLTTALAAAQQLQIAAVFLEVRASNHAAQALYARHDFAMVGTRRNYYRTPREDAQIWRVNLPGA